MGISTLTQRRSTTTAKNVTTSTIIAMADMASWYCSIIIIAFIFLTFFRDYNLSSWSMSVSDLDQEVWIGTNSNILRRSHGACDEIYVVGEGETLHSISDKCGDPFIVERNPHIHDPDDVFPGLVIKIMPVLPIHTN